jgi:ferredoxin-NADP reductase
LIRRSEETSRGANLVFAVDGWRGHRAGQHVDLRLTADDGYQAQRSYSIASTPQPGVLTLTVERIEGGEVSPYLVDEMRVGDVAEIRGPIGDWFVWSRDERKPLLLIGGGFGIVPLMSMLRHRSAVGGSPSARLIVSARTGAEIPYAQELDLLASGDLSLEVRRVLTRRQPGEPPGSGRLNRLRLSELAYQSDLEPAIFVCGPTGFVEAVTGGLVELGHDPVAIHAERFGPTGDEIQPRAA